MSKKSRDELPSVIRKTKEIPDEEYARIIKRFEYSCLEYQYTEMDKREFWYAIVVREKSSGAVIKLTGYEDLLLSKPKQGFHNRKPTREELYYITNFLQYALIDNYGVYKARDVREIRIEMVEQWLREYASTPTTQGFFPRKEAVVRHRNTVCMFLWLLCGVYKKKMKYLKKKDILEMKYVLQKNGEWTVREPIPMPLYKIPIPCFDVDTGLRALVRDMPSIILPVFIEICQREDPELTFAVILASYMGLRGGEVCNTRQLYSMYGPGIIITREDGEITAIQIDLHKEFALRSDGVKVGGIKRARYATAFGRFVPVVAHFYEKHLKLIEGKTCEPSMPMFMNRYAKNGVYMAMTVDNYHKRVGKIFDKVLDVCKYNPKRELQAFRDGVLQNRHWGAHAFRHWYTVRLVQFGCTSEQLMDFRGDGQIKSSETYIKNKKELFKEFKEVNDELGYLIRTGKELV